MARKKYPSDRSCYNVSFPEGLKERIKDAAWENRRSMNAEIVARLEESFSTQSQATGTDVSIVLDTIMFRLAPVTVWMSHTVNDGNIGPHYNPEHVKKAILEGWENTSEKDGCTDFSGIDLRDYNLLVYSEIELTANGMEWAVTVERGMEGAKPAWVLKPELESCPCKTREQAEEVFFSHVSSEFSKHAAFLGIDGQIKVSNAQLLKWPRSLLQKMESAPGVTFVDSPVRAKAG